jgi:hypothetical protein
MPSEKKKTKEKEPVMLVRPAVRSLGLDYLHVSLIVLVIILIGLALVLSVFRPGAISCQYSIASNGTCATPHHTASQALSSAEQVLASYETFNSSLDLLPYYSLPNKANVSYLSNQSEWLVVIPEINPLVNNTRYYVSFLLYDSNLSVAKPFIMTAAPPGISQNKVVSYGVVSLYGKSGCALSANTPIPIYAFIDPYAPGAVEGMLAGANATSTFKSAINVSYKFIFTGYETKISDQYGVNDTQYTSENLWCASQQSGRFAAYLANYSILFNGAPLISSQLASVATGSGMNMSKFSACMNIAPSILNNQVLFASYYSIMTTPTFIIDCQYQTIPETLNSAVQYAISNKG